jgi:hypothetical protein
MAGRSSKPKAAVIGEDLQLHDVLLCPSSCVRHQAMLVQVWPAYIPVVRVGSLRHWQSTASVGPNFHIWNLFPGLPAVGHQAVLKVVARLNTPQ